MFGWLISRFFEDFKRNRSLICLIDLIATSLVSFAVLAFAQSSQYLSGIHPSIHAENFGYIVFAGVYLVLSMSHWFSTVVRQFRGKNDSNDSKTFGLFRMLFEPFIYLFVLLCDLIVFVFIWPSFAIAQLVNLSLKFLKRESKKNQKHTESVESISSPDMSSEDLADVVETENTNSAVPYIFAKIEDWIKRNRALVWVFGCVVLFTILTVNISLYRLDVRKQYNTANRAKISGEDLDAIEKSVQKGEIESFARSFGIQLFRWLSVENANSNMLYKALRSQDCMIYRFGVNGTKASTKMVRGLKEVKSIKKNWAKKMKSLRHYRYKLSSKTDLSKYCGY